MDLKTWWFNNGDKILRRVKSFVWRAACVAGVAGASWAAEHLNLLEVPMWLQGFLGLGLGEVTKWLNNHTDLFGGRQK